MLRLDHEQDDYASTTLPSAQPTPQPSAADSRAAWVLPTDEELMIAQHIGSVLDLELN